MKILLKSCIALVAFFTASQSPAALSIVIDGITPGTVGGGAGNRTLQAGFDASGSSKLVVVLGGEHGFGGNVGGNFNSATLNGTPLLQIQQEGTSFPTAAMFYLDNPGAAGIGDLVINQANHNGSHYAVYLLSNTKPGFAASAKNTSNSVSLATTAPDSLVIAGVNNSGPNGGNGSVDMIADSPLSNDAASIVGGGRRWTTFGAGSALVGSPSLDTYSFSDGSIPQDHVMAIVAAEFLVLPEPGAASLLTLGLLSLIHRRRRA